MDKLMDIVGRSIEDYGFRQIAQWSPDDVVSMWDLSDKEAEILRGVVKRELDRLPVPVEPFDYEKEKTRLRKLIQQAMS